MTIIKRIKANLLLSSLLFLIFCGMAFSVYAYTTNMYATVVLGQANFANNNANRGTTVNSNTMNAPRGVKICNGKLIMADLNNNRVLIWNTVPTTSDVAADVVIGQPNMTSSTANNGGISAATLSGPFGLACTSGGKLIIGDSSNARVLIYNSIPTTNGASADLVLGQADFTHNSVNQGVSNLGLYDSCINQTARANTLRSAEAIATDDTRLVVDDGLNQRILIWNTFPTTMDQPADLVVGQPNLNTVNFNDACPAYVSCGPNSVGGEPIGVEIYGNKLIVSNTFTVGGHRVTIWNSWPTVNDQYPDVVVGQADFTHCSANRGGSAAANTLNNPFGVAVDSSGKLFITDRTNRRILIYNSIPTTNGASADLVIGQPDFTSTSLHQGQSSPAGNTLQGARMLSVNNYKLFVADGDNNRLLVFNDDIPSSGGSNSSGSNSSLPAHDPPVCSDAKPAAAPDLFQVERNTTGDAITIHYSPVSPSSYYYISYSEDSNAERYGVQIDQTANGVMSYTIGSLNPHSTYYIKVRGGNGCQPGPWSNIKEIKSRQIILASNEITTHSEEKTIEITPTQTTIQSEQITPAQQDNGQDNGQNKGATDTQTNTTTDRFNFAWFGIVPLLLLALFFLWRKRKK